MAFEQGIGQIPDLLFHQHHLPGRTLVVSANGLQGKFHGLADVDPEVLDHVPGLVTGSAVILFQKGPEGFHHLHFHHAGQTVDVHHGRGQDLVFCAL